MEEGGREGGKEGGKEGGRREDEEKGIAFISVCLFVQLAVQENYRDNPFHNFRHCFCVTQMVSMHFMKLGSCVLCAKCVVYTICLCHN